MVLIDVPAPVAEAFRLGESSGAKMQWRCSSSANYLSVGLRWISSEGERSRAGLNSRQRRSQRRLQGFLQRKNTGASEERRFLPSCLQQDDFDSSKRAPQNLRVNLSSGEHDLDLKDIPPAQLTTQGGSRPPRADTFAAKGSRLLHFQYRLRVQSALWVLRARPLLLLRLMQQLKLFRGQRIARHRTKYNGSMDTE